MNHYYTSTGERLSSKVIEGRIKLAKAKKIQQMHDKHGYVFCEDCKRNDCKPVDCSHDISVKQCKEDPNTPLELAWDVANITMRGRSCHQKYDKLNLIFNKK